MKAIVQKAMRKGYIAEAVSKSIYNKGESGDFTADIMQAVSPTGVVFNGCFNHNGRRHYPDGYIQIGRTMHIFEMKDGAPHAKAHEGQVNRYAHVMNIAMDFDRVITYIIYGSRKEVVIEGYNARDIHVVYSATRYTDDRDYSWKADKYASMSDADRAVNNEKKRVGALKEYAKRTPEQVAEINRKRRERRAAKKAANNGKVKIRKANLTAEQVIAEREKKRIGALKEYAKRTPEQVAEINRKRRERRAAKKAADNGKVKIRKANLTPEQVITYRERNRIAEAKKYALRTPEQVAEINRKRRERRAAKKAANK